jgi:hypothetical protein
MLRALTYIDVYNQAVNAYASQAERPGYQPTLFLTWVRHDREKYPALIELETELLTAVSRDAQKIILEKWLQDPRLKANDHSFRTYFVDALIQAFPDEAWEKYDKKPLIFYSSDGFLYRGSLQHPDDAFKNGMHSSSHAKDIEDFAALMNYSAGVSTSKSVTVAKSYSSQLKMDHYGVHEFTGFIYQIHYRGNAGIDIEATQRKRGILIPLKGTKQEVNIVSSIPPEDIVGHGYVDENKMYVQIKANPQYQPDKTSVAVLDKKSQLEQLFPVEKRSTCSIL